LAWVFVRVIERAGSQHVRIPPSAPSRNAQLERFIGSFKPEEADRLFSSGESHLQRVVDEYLAHCHRERNHQGFDEKII